MSATRSFGFYAHHHGRGHLSRVAAICAALGPARCTVATSHPDATDVLPHGTDVRCLPLDVPPEPVADVTADGALHWAPVHPISTVRTHAITGWLLERRPTVVLVDVSVEVALTVRLAGVPVVVVRLHGDRRDAPHDLAHRVADSVIAPFPAELEHPSTPPWVLGKTVHSGFVATMSRPAPVPARRDPSPRVLVAWGRGHPPPSAADVDAAAAATPARVWEMVGPPCPDGRPERARHHGWVDDIGTHVSGAAVVVGPPGDGLVGDVARAGARFVAVCEPRPFDEHRHKADGLAAVGAAVALDAWPTPARWPTVLRQAEALDPQVLAAFGADGADRIAEHLAEVAGAHRGRAA